MDDFGDLYTDLEGHVNAGVDTIPIIRQLHPKHGAKAEASSGDDDDGSGDGERLLYGRIGETGHSDEKPAFMDSEVKAPGGPDTEVGEFDVWEEESNDSDSEDDLHIVLNEDCSNFPPSRRVGSGNVGTLAEGNVGEEVDDELAFATGEDRVNKDQKWVEPSQVLADGLEQSLSKGGAYPLQYSQYKYVRSHSAVYSSNTKSIGPGGAFYCPISSRGDFGVNGGNQLSTSCQLGFPAEMQNAFGFSLPRNRTIFDISIEMFDRKPWRNQGVDISDFFNFGLNEKSWKHYYESLQDLFRKQTTTLSRNPIYESLRPNQPKGRAIQVEGGIGERRPSMDTRRPRHQDSDVVIQITMEGSVEDASIPCKEELELFDDSVLNFKDRVNEGSSATIAVHKLLPLHHDAQETQGIANCDEQPKVTVVGETDDEVKAASDFKENDDENPSRMDTFMSLIESASGNLVLHSSSPSFIESHSEASRDCFSLDKVHSPKKSSLGSVTELQDSFMSDLSDDSRSDNGNTERKDGRLDLQDHNLIREEQNCCPGTNHHHAAQKSVSEDNDDSIYFYRKGQRDSDFFKAICGRKKRKLGHNIGKEEEFSSYRETKMSSLSYGSRRCAKKQVNKSSHIKYLHRKGDLNPFVNQSCHRRDHLLGQRVFRDPDIKIREGHFFGEGQNWRGMEVIDHNKYVHAISECTSFSMEDCSSQRKKTTKGDHCSQMDANDFINENRYREGYIQWNDERHLPYSDREEEINLDKFSRHVPYTSRDLSSSLRRENHERRLWFELDDSHRYVGINLRHSHHGSSDAQSCRGLQTLNRRGWHDASPPRKYMHRSERSNEGYMDYRRLANTRDVQSKKQRDRDLVDSGSMEHCFSSKRKDLDFDIGHYSTEEGVAYPERTDSREKRRYNWVSEFPDIIDNEASHRHQERNDSHSPETYLLHQRRLRRENSFNNHNTVTDGKISNNHMSDDVGNGITVMRNADFEARGQNYTMRCREAVRGHLKCCEEKFLRRCSKVAVKRKKRRDTDLRMDTEQQDFSRTEELHVRKEVPPRSPKMEGPHIRAPRSKVVRVRQHSYEHCAIQNNEQWHDKHAVVQDQDSSALEEGQIVEELEDKDVGTVTKNWESGTVQCSFAEVNQSDNKEETKVKAKGSSNNNKLVVGYDNDHILETLAKMERRRERFKEPIVPKNVPEKIVNSQSQVTVETVEVKPERPTRKRRWQGS